VGGHAETGHQGPDARAHAPLAQGRPAPLAAWLDAYKHAPDLVLFPSREGLNKLLTRVQAWQLLQKAARAAVRSGRIGFHRLCKSFDQRVHAELGYDINATREWLGHKWVTSTQTYLGNDPQRLWLIDAADVERALTAARGPRPVPVPNDHEEEAWPRRPMTPTFTPGRKPRPRPLDAYAQRVFEAHDENQPP
jgi:hypothetical protein